VPTISNAP